MAAGMVDLGAVLYAMVAVVFERGVDMVFWALERKKQREQENKAKNQAALLTELLEKGIIQPNEELEQWARERGIPLDKATPR